ncbi:MAG: ParB/RepB/Spo0J family partition protein [Clostridia bacterium]|nr:ParB/RepB/Spo0J family partition protein [Clostridia bacterium]
MNENIIDLDLLVDEFTDNGGFHRRLVYIPIDKLFPHPDNPRKEIGDVSELAESIISNGIMQNLTVVRNIRSSKSYDRLVDGFDENGVKYSDAYVNHAISHAFEDSYTVIIGHRRLEAAKLAGITEIPCVISDMDYSTQIATMMTENLQRVDLTIYEQAQCFKQMKLDLGMSTDKIAEKTGFSTATVRRRLKLCDLNQDTLQKVSCRQISMDDFDRLYKIEDPKIRDQALAEIGTANFNNRYAAAVQEQEKKKKIEAWRKLCLESGMTEIKKKKAENTSVYAHDFAIYTGEPSRKALDGKLEGKDGTKLFFYVDQWTYVHVYRKAEHSAGKKTAEQLKREAERTAKDEAIANLKEAFERAYSLRFNFIKSYNDLHAKRHVLDILNMGAEAIRFNSTIQRNTFYILSGYTDEKLNEMDKKPTFDDICEITKAGAHQLLVFYIYATMGDTTDLHPYYRNTWDVRYGQYDADSRDLKLLTAIYNGLVRLGYEMSDEEKALMDGTSDLYYRNEENTSTKEGV